MPAPPSARAWASLSPPLSPWLLDATAALGLERMTPVQASTIPLFMGHKDVVVEAVTGSGKTLAFLIPVIERLLRLEAPVKKHHVAGIILSPTRELATQIYTVLESLLQFHPASAEHRQALQDRENPPSTTAEIIRQSQQAGDGGLPNDAAVAAQQADEAREHRHKHKDKSRKSSRHDLRIVPQLLLGGATSPAQDLSVFLARSPNLLVATPGRLLELLSSPHVHCPQSAFEVLVLDEADRLLDLGFKDDLQRILARLPKQRRTGLFSASVSEAVDQLVHVGLRNPVKIAVKVKSASGALDKMTPASLQMTYLLTTPSQKLPTVANIFRRMAAQQHGPGLPAKSIIYFSTCAAVDYFQHVVPALLPPELGLTTVPLHGKHPPAARAKNFARFVDAATPAVLLTTDVAARGLDVPSVDLVVQVDPSSDPKAFMHRCGRAGRAGRRGLSIVLLCPGREEDYVGYMEVRKTPITPYVPPPLLPPPGASESASESASDAGPGTVVATPRQAEEAAATIRTLVLADRALNDKAQRAFVSWVRSYTQHQASSIFRIADQDWVDLARGWGLLKLPRMPETKNWDGDYRLGLHIDWDAYAYKDKAREKARLEKMQEERQAAAAGKAGDADDAHRKESAKRSMPWSEKHEKRETKMRKKDRQRAKKEHERWEKMSEEERRRVTETQEMVSKMREENLRLRAERRAFANGGKPSTTAATTAPAGGSSIEDDTFEGFSD